MKTFEIFYRSDNAKAAVWAKRIEAWLKGKKARLGARPDFVIVLGGDGTILEAARNYQKQNPIIIGLNLGRVGFLASVRAEKDFLKGLEKALAGKYQVSARTMIDVSIKRRGKAVFSGNALNDVAVINPVGVVELEILVENNPVQYIQGSGALVTTATGSTGYNLSAHGPMVMPTIDCLILTEILDHNIPTPSIVLDAKETISINVKDFRQRDLFKLTSTNEKVDVVASIDGATIFPIQKGDVLTIQKSKKSVRFAEFEKGYFFKSLQEKFAFK